MNVLLLYDTLFGNTRKIAAAIHSSFLASNKVSFLRVDEILDKDVKPIDLLIIGSPNINGKVLPSIIDFVNSIPDEDAKRIQFACFDVRIEPTIELKETGKVSNIEGYAAYRLDKLLSKKGAKWIIAPVGFLKLEKEGPLKEGETERAKNWAKKIIAKVGSNISSY